MKTLLGGVTLLLALLAWTGTAAAADRNKCGCYKNPSGTCFCDKKAKCGCPGDCEPKGCESAREKAIQKEIEAETRKAAEADRKRTTVATGGKSAAGARSGADKPSPDKGSSGGEGRAGGDATKSKPASKKLTAAQTKQLVKLLDDYFQENPDARSRNAEELRNQLSQSR